MLVLALAAGCGSDDGDSSAEETDLQTVSFQEPDDPGPWSPFTDPSDVEGDEEVRVSNTGSGSSSGSGAEDKQPFGGSGSNRVCDRDKLIRFLRGHPAIMREWARVLGVEPRIRAVERYIAKLHPVTLTRDTQVTNHALKDGKATPFQAILQAGTAVLVDKYGTPVVRCYCGNPLKPAVFVKTAKCNGCPPNYKPPKQCSYGRKENYDETYYRRDHYGNSEYDEVFIRRHGKSRFGDCYKPYPDPPTVTIISIYRRPRPPTTPAAPPPEPAPEPAPQPAPAPRTNTVPPAPEPEPAPEPTPTTPDICNDGLDNEGEPGLIDGDDPNCQ